MYATLDVVVTGASGYRYVFHWDDWSWKDLANAPKGDASVAGPRKYLHSLGLY